METKLVPINSVIPNSENPRYIKEDKFEKLVKSIKDFPEMLQLRPIVINDQNVILGGNMRYKACVEAGVKKIPVIKADQLTPEQQREFIIKDNVSGGNWDWDIIANEWNTDELEDWGLDVINVDWDELDYIDEDVEKPELSNDLTIKVSVPKELEGDLSMIQEGLRLWLNDNYVGCEVK
jgi:hypothetical protein